MHRYASSYRGLLNGAQDIEDGSTFDGLPEQRALLYELLHSQ